MGRLYVKDILKKFYLSTSITGMGAQHLRSLFMPSSIQMPTATGKARSSQSGCNAKRQPSFNSEALVVSFGPEQISSNARTVQSHMFGQQSGSGYISNARNHNLRKVCQPFPEWPDFDDRHSNCVFLRSLLSVRLNISEPNSGQNPGACKHGSSETASRAGPPMLSSARRHCTSPRRGRLVEWSD